VKERIIKATERRAEATEGIVKAADRTAKVTDGNQSDGKKS